jgi:hypothetical protein
LQQYYNIIIQKDEVGGHEVANKTVVIVEEQENPLPYYTESQKRSPSPVHMYAEVQSHKTKKEDHSAIRERSQSPEYSQIEIVNKHYCNKDIIANQKNQVTTSEVNTFPNPCYHTVAQN